MAKIERIRAREVLDSRGNPTVQAEVHVAGGIVGRAMVPSGASTGEHEAHESRDNDQKRFLGKGVLTAVKNVNVEINAALSGKDTANQEKIDRTMLELDGTTDKSRLGANAILAVSLAAARTEAKVQGLPLYLYLQQHFPKRELVLPVPQMNLINGGKHASNNISIQEYHVVPIGAPSFSESLRMCVEIHAALRVLLTEAGFPVELGDEGGFAPRIDKSDDVFTLLVAAIERAGYLPGVDAFLGIDAAANEFFEPTARVYLLDGATLSPIDLAYHYTTWRERYPLISIEDPFEDDSWADWRRLMERNGHTMQIVGDDLYATNATRIAEGIKQGATNAVLIKPNQVGTLTETFKAILFAQESGQRIIISHRSGDTEDDFIADLSVAVGAGQIKTGAPMRSERTSKYNRLLLIEETLNGTYAKPFRDLLAKNQTRSEKGSTELATNVAASAMAAYTNRPGRNGV